jgi:putative transposase
VFELTQSMSRKADCYDNAVAESFFANYKTECLPLCGSFDTRAHARTETFDYIEVFYNRQRLHSTLNYATPVEHEQQHAVIVGVT